jgi:hypothetical protein
MSITDITKKMQTLNLLQVRAARLGAQIQTRVQQMNADHDVGSFYLCCAQTGALIWGTGLLLEGIANALNCFEAEITGKGRDAWEDFGEGWNKFPGPTIENLRHVAIRVATLKSGLEETYQSCDVLEDGDAIAFVSCLIEQIVDVLSRHPRMPRLSYDEWSLIFADLRCRLEEQVTDLIEGKVDADDFIETAVEQSWSWNYDVDELPAERDIT